MENLKNSIIACLDNVKAESPGYYNDIISEINEYESDNSTDMLNFFSNFLYSDNRHYFTISSKDNFNHFENTKEGYSFVYSPLNDHSRPFMHKGDVVFCYRQGQFGNLEEALNVRGIYAIGICIADPKEIYHEESGHNRWGVAITIPVVINKHLELRNIQLNPTTINLTPYNGNRNDSLQYIENKEHYKTLLELVCARNKNKKEQLEKLFKETIRSIVLPDDVWNSSSTNNYTPQINLPLQQIFYGAPGTGKSHTINKETKGESVIRTTFHPDSDYSTFVGAYKPTSTEIAMRDVTGRVIKDANGKDVMENRIIYEFVEQAFLQAYVKAWKNVVFHNGQKQYLVIEEINRGNCAQIFGDLFQLLDRNNYGFSDYPINADKDIQKFLRKAFARTDEPDKQIFLQDVDKQHINQMYDDQDDVVSKVFSGEILLLPNNFYIWATMNTSDQSLFPIDSAFKRRWDWKYVPISKKDADFMIEVEKEVDVDGEMKRKTFHYDWWGFLDRVNTAISKATSSEDKKLGYFFCKASKKIADTDKEPRIITADTFVGKVVFYLWNDVFKDYEIGDAKFHYGEDDLSLLSTKVGEDEIKREFSSFFDEFGNAKHEAVAKLLDDLKVEGKEVVDGGSDESAAAGGFLKVIFPDGYEICEPKPLDTFINSITHIASIAGYEAIADLGIMHDGFPFLSKIVQNKHAVRKVGDNDEWRIQTTLRHHRKVEILRKISDELKINLDIIIQN